jgi:hypothetical protein
VQHSADSGRSLGKHELPKRLVDLYNEYSFTAFEDSFAFAYDDLGSWSRATTHLQDVVQSTLSLLSDDRLRAQENEAQRKSSVNWRDLGYGTLFVEDASELTTRNRSQAAALTKYFKDRAAAYIAALRTMTPAAVRELFDSGVVILGKGKGAPYWNPSSDKTAALSLAKLASVSASLKELTERVMSAGAALLPLLQTSYIRVQSSAKPIPQYAVIDGRLVNVGERYGPKRRRIGAQPFITNHLWAGAGNVLRTLMATMDDRTTGTTLPASAFAINNPDMTAYAFDFSSYDTTVAVETTHALHEYTLQPILHELAVLGVISRRELRLLLEIDVQAQSMPVLLPPRTMSEAGWIAPAQGQIRSGVNLTSWIGTEINRCFKDYKTKELGIQAGDIHHFNYGDDTLIFFRRDVDARAWADNATLLGFVETLAPDATFLMRRIPDGYNYFTRMLYSCINREPAQEPLTVLSAAAAFRTRYDLLKGHPLQPYFWRTLAEWDGPERFREALRMAQSVTDTVALNVAAAGETIKTQPDTGADAQLELASRLATRDARYQQIVNVIEQFRVDSRFQMSTLVLRQAIDSISVDISEAYLREQSYVTQRQKALATR